MRDLAALRAAPGWNPQSVIAKYFPAVADFYRAVQPEIRAIEARLDDDEARGLDTSCLRQALRELRWRFEYTADAACAAPRRNSLPRPESQGQKSNPTRNASKPLLLKCLRVTVVPLAGEWQRNFEPGLSRDTPQS
jgi:hypothetical protein